MTPDSRSSISSLLSRTFCLAAVIGDLLAAHAVPRPPEQLASIAAPVAEARVEQPWATIAQLRFPSDTTVGFRETRKTRLQREARSQKGELWLSENGSFVMSITEPRTEERRITGTTLSLTRRGKTRSTTLNAKRGAHQLLLAIVAVLQGNVTQLQKQFDIQPSTHKLRAGAGVNAESEDLNWEWTLTPKDSALQKELSALVVGGTGNQLRSLRAERGQSFQEITLLSSQYTHKKISNTDLPARRQKP